MVRRISAIKMTQLAASLAVFVIGMGVLAGCAFGSPAAAQPDTTQAATPRAEHLATLMPKAPATATPLPRPIRPIYVLDPNFQFGFDRVSRILEIDPDTGKHHYNILTRYLPAAALSPDGRRMFVADTYWTRVTRGEAHEVLSVFDISQGQWVADEIPASGRLKYKGFPIGEGFLFFSDDGTRLYLMKYGDLDIHQIRMAALDPDSLETLHEGPYPPCGRRIQVHAERWVCANSSGSVDGGFTVSIDAVDPETGAVLEHLLSVEHGTSAVALSSDQETLYLVGRNASVAVIDMPQRRVVSHELRDTALGMRIAHDAILSPDGRRLYVGFDTDQSSGWGQVDTILVFDTTTWDRIAAIPARDPVMHFALSAEGDQLYAVSPDAQSFTIYDTSSFREVAELRDLGGTPARIIVPPATEE